MKRPQDLDQKTYWRKLHWWERMKKGDFWFYAIEGVWVPFQNYPEGRLAWGNFVVRRLNSERCDCFGKTLSSD